MMHDELLSRLEKREEKRKAQTERVLQVADKFWEAFIADLTEFAKESAERGIDSISKPKVRGKGTDLLEAEITINHADKVVVYSREAWTTDFRADRLSAKMLVFPADMPDARQQVEIEIQVPADQPANYSMRWASNKGWKDVDTGTIEEAREAGRKASHALLNFYYEFSFGWREDVTYAQATSVSGQKGRLGFPSPIE